MQLLKLEKSKFYRIKGGQTAAEAERALRMPVENCFAGKIVAATCCEVYEARPFDTYASVAAAFGVGEEELENFNFSRPIYPTRIIYVPR